MRVLILEHNGVSRKSLINLVRNNYPEIFIDEISSISELKGRPPENYDLVILGRNTEKISERVTLRAFRESDNSSEVIIVYGDCTAEQAAIELGAKFFERGIPSERDALIRYLKTLRRNHQIS